MLMLSPVCHLHYFCLALPLAMGLIARQWEANESARVSPGLTLLLAVNFLGNGVTHLPGAELARDLGLAAGATMLLWLAAVVALWRGRPHPHCQARLLPVATPVSVNEGAPLRRAG
jgi:hypothetical protein